MSAVREAVRLALALGFAGTTLGASVPVSPSAPPPERVAPKARAGVARAAATKPGELSVSSFGARGDGVTPDTDAIQAAVDALRPGQTLRFPAGTYLIDTAKGVRLKDAIRLELGNATLVGPNVDRARCRIFEIQGRQGVQIRGGTLRGSRAGSPEWGVGVSWRATPWIS
jgi:hypothetical protein